MSLSTSKRNRRAFLQTAAFAAGFNAVRTVTKGTAVAYVSTGSPDQVAQRAPTVAANEGKKPLRLGLILGIGKEPGAALAKVHDLGLPSCQVFVDEIEIQRAAQLRQADRKSVV